MATFSLSTEAGWAGRRRDVERIYLIMKMDKRSTNLLIVYAISPAKSICIPIRIKPNKSNCTAPSPRATSNLGLGALVVVGHLETSAAETTLDVEALVGFTAVENALVAAGLFRNVVEGLDQAESELLALLVAGDGNVFDVADGAKAVDAVVEDRSVSWNSNGKVWNTPGKHVRGGGGEKHVQLVLDNQGTRGDNRRRLARRVLDDDDVVCALGTHVLELLGKCLLGHIANGGQDTQAVEEAGRVVGATQGSQAVALGEGSLDLGGEEVVGEELSSH